VLRFWNNDVLQNFDGVLQTIAAELVKFPLTQPSPQGERALSCDVDSDVLSPRGVRDRVRGPSA
jgi:hypothetical protein